MKFYSNEQNFYNMRRVSSIFEAPYVMAGVLFLISFGLSFEKKQRYIRHGLVGMLATFLTQSRAGIFGALVFFSIHRIGVYFSLGLGAVLILYYEFVATYLSYFMGFLSQLNSISTLLIENQRTAQIFHILTDPSAVFAFSQSKNDMVYLETEYANAVNQFGILGLIIFSIFTIQIIVSTAQTASVYHMLRLLTYSIAFIIFFYSFPIITTLKTGIIFFLLLGGTPINSRVD